MIKRLLLTTITALCIISCRHNSEMAGIINDVASVSVRQCLIMEKSLDSLTMPKTFRNGKLVKSDMRWWCSGFFPGTCWYSWLISSDEEIFTLAKAQTERMLDVDSYFTNHDIGFQIMCSAGMAYRHTGDERYLPSIRRAAELLASRYSPTTGTIKSWDDSKYSYPVIIDNMMNLELLTFASRQFGEPKWAEIAISHADKTIANHFRADYSTYHLIEYDEADGSVMRKRTHQGYNDESVWSRGQAWGLYGFTMMYRETGLERFLTQAEKIAGFLLPQLADNPVPIWDFSAPYHESAQVDASAAAIISAAMLELSTLTKSTSLSKVYFNQAEMTIRALASPEYLAEEGEIGGFILKHSTGFLRKNSEVDAPLTYADYYFLETLYRYKCLKKGKSLFNF